MTVNISSVNKQQMAIWYMYITKTLSEQALSFPQYPKETSPEIFRHEALVTGAKCTFDSLNKIKSNNSIMFHIYTIAVTYK